MKHPYETQPDKAFWATGVRNSLVEHGSLDVEPLTSILDKDDVVVSAGSCFAQHVGKELFRRGYGYAKSAFSGERVESFGLGNVYTIRQLKQWLEYGLGQREWAEQTLHVESGRYYDYLLPHLGKFSSLDDIQDHRREVADELVRQLTCADVFVFTLGLTEAWVNSEGDVYPSCPGVMVGCFDESCHQFVNLTFSDVLSDLKDVEARILEINPNLNLVFTVSPVPLTGTATDEHVLIATNHSKSILRAALGEFLKGARSSSYFPSYELITHNTLNDWRFQENLRTVSTEGVAFVMQHAFGDARNKASARGLGKAGEIADEAFCEESLIEAHQKLGQKNAPDFEFVLVGDSHMEHLAKALEGMGVAVAGGQVMNGSGFTDGKFELSESRVFVPKESPESKEIWDDLFEKIENQADGLNILTNIGFQTHRTINGMANHFRELVVTFDQSFEYFNEKYRDQIEIWSRLSRYGRVWLIEDPSFYAFISNKTDALIVRDKNFPVYCACVREAAKAVGVEYLDPCNAVMQKIFHETGSVVGAVGPDGFHGSEKYYEVAARVLTDTIYPKTVGA